MRFLKGYFVKVTLFYALNYPYTTWFLYKHRLVLHKLGTI